MLHNFFCKFCKYLIHVLCKLYDHDRVTCKIWELLGKVCCTKVEDKLLKGSMCRLKFVRQIDQAIVGLDEVVRWENFTV